MCIEGIQPTIPENPPQASKDQQKKEILDTKVKTAIDKVPKPVPEKSRHRHKTVDLVKVKELSTHELSVVSIDMDFMVEKQTHTKYPRDQFITHELFNVLKKKI